MSARFIENKKSAGNSSARAYIFPILRCLVIIVAFSFAANRTTDKTLQKQKETLESAVNRCMMHCYAIEGSYPESVDYLEKNYGLTYNKEEFYVGYQVFGTDVLPDVTIIEK